MRYMFFTFSFIFFSVKKFFNMKLFFHIKIFFSVNNVYFVKNTQISFQKKNLLFNLVLQQMNNHSNEGRKIEAVTTQNSWHEKINEPTHILNNFSLCIDLIFNRIWCSPILHRSCHGQMIYIKFNLDIVYPPPYQRDFVLSNGEYWSCQTWIKWIWLGKSILQFWCW